MRVSSTAIAYAYLASLLAEPVFGFTPTKLSNSVTQRTRSVLFDMGAPDAAPVESVQQAAAPVVQRVGGAPGPVRYSEFLKLVDSDQIEKVTFSSDGTKLLAVDNDGGRVAIEALPNDPELLNQLTKHKVDVTVLPAQEEGGLGALAQSLVLPAVLFGGLFFLSRRSGGGMPGGMGGPGGPMGMGKSKAQ